MFNISRPPDSASSDGVCHPVLLGSTDGVEMEKTISGFEESMTVRTDAGEEICSVQVKVGWLTPPKTTSSAGGGGGAQSAGGA